MRIDRGSHSTLAVQRTAYFKIWLKPTKNALVPITFFTSLKFFWHAAEKCLYSEDFI